MPFTGGWSPSPERTGGGDANTATTLLQRVFESLASQRGDAYDQTVNSAVGIENMAYARALVFDGYFANQRLINNCIPSKATLVTGMLQRWENILAQPPLPGDSERVRRARVTYAWGRIGDPNTIQPVVDALKVLLGPVYVGIVHQTVQNALVFVNGVTPVTSSPTNAPVVMLSGTPLIESMIQMAVITGGSLGTAQVDLSIDGGRTFPYTGLVTSAATALAGTGLTASFSAGTYSTSYVYTAQTSPNIPWMSTLARIDVQVTYAPLGYHNANGTPNAVFFETVGTIAPTLDQMLPIWTDFQWMAANSLGTIGFILDDPNNLDLEALNP